jgi:hypothetical protein
MIDSITWRAAHSLLRCVVFAAVATLLAALSAEQATAQQPTQQPRTPAPRRQATIEIRGQVPTPQVVTVRPRETPSYSRRVLVPAFLDHDFWPSILPPLEIVSPPAAIRSDTTSRSAADSAAARARSSTPPPSGTPPAPLRR